MSGSEQWHALVAVQRGASDRLPFFCVHGAGGNVLNFHPLARKMSPRQPFFGLQALGVDGIHRPHRAIEQMAQAYLAEVRAKQPRGPYLVGGYSGGGVVAYEMACQLTAAGETVALLALVDTMHPRIPVRRMSLASRLSRLHEEGFAYVAEALRRPWDNARRRMELRKVEHHLERGQTIPLALRDLHLVQNFRRIVAGFDPKPWPGRATLFRAERIPYLYRDAGPAYGWDRCAEHGVDIVYVAGDHHTVLLRRNVEPLAQTLGAAIERAANAVRFDAN